MAIVYGYEQVHAEARQILDPQVYDFFATGSGIEETLAASESAWKRMFLRPRALRDVSDIAISTSLLGTEIAAPVAVAPIGYLEYLHPDGTEVFVKSISEAGNLLTLSTRASSRFERIASLAKNWWFQVYVLRDRGLTAELVRRAVDAGTRALVLTADTPYVGSKARLQNSALPKLTTALLPELSTREDDGIMQSPTVTSADIGWLHDLADGLPIVVKGILRADDARDVVDAGASAVWVSNHGGRQLDGAVPTALALPEVAAAVGDDVEVYVDGGVRTGRDVVRALALGARAAFLGRPIAWALAVGGAEGVCEFLTAMYGEIRETLALAGCSSLDDVTPDLVHGDPDAGRFTSGKMPWPLDAHG